MIVVFDTNIWMQNLYLRSAVGTAVRFFLLHGNTRVALPEVVRLEVQHHLQRDLRNHVSTVQSGHAKLLAIFGQLKEVSLPTTEQIEDIVENVFNNSQLDFLEIPFSLESAMQSLLKTIKGLPPSHRNQQFKDGVLWSDCLQLLDIDDVTLVSHDAAFYEANDFSKGLSLALRQELPSSGHEFTILPELSDLLRNVAQQITVDDKALGDCFLSGADGKSATDMAARNGFEVHNLSNCKYSVFATELVTRLAIEYEMEFNCADISGQGRENAALKIKGDGFYEPKSEKFDSLSPLGMEIVFRDQEGNLQQRAGVYIRVGTMVIGHANVNHVVRHRL